MPAVTSHPRFVEATLVEALADPPAGEATAGFGERLAVPIRSLWEAR